MQSAYSNENLDMSNTDLSGRDKIEGEGRSSSSLIDLTDLILTVCIFAVCAFLYWATTQFETVPDLFAQDVGPAFFPRLLIWTIVILTLALPMQSTYGETCEYLPVITRLLISSLSQSLV